MTRLISPTISQRAAHQAYGGRESGHEAADEPNPSSATHEHPGPESPASGSNGGKQQSTSSISSGGSSKIHQPPEPDEHANDEVRRHNEELRRTHDQPVEKSPDEEKVDKKFWQGKFN